MKKTILIAAILAVVGGGYFLYARQAAARDQAAAADTRQIAVAARGNINITVSASGRVEPEREVEIKSKASGEVIRVYYDISDQVEQGKLLFQLDPTDEERSVARLRASLAMSQAKLEQVKLGVEAAETKLRADRARAEADLKSAEAEQTEYAARLRRAEQLHQQRVITREELDTAMTKAVQTESAVANARAKMDDLVVQELELDRTRQEVAIAEAQVETDSVSLADAEQRLKETNVYAPITGVVSERSVQEGFIVASGVSNVGGGTTTMKIIDLSHVYAIAAVDEADISGIAPGVKAIVTADAYKGMEFQGEVVRVATTGVVESNVVTFDVKVEVQGRGRRLLKPEMTTNVTFLVDDRQDVIILPAQAVVRKAVQVEDAPAAAETAPAANAAAGAGRRGRLDYSRRQTFVTVVGANGAEEERRVETGLTDGYLVEIVSGVAEGERVMYQPETQSRWAGQGGRRPGPPPPM